MNKIGKQLLAATTATTLLLGSTVNCFAADFTEDGSATVPINAEVTVAGSYTLSLPASVDILADVGLYNTYAKLNVTGAVAFENMSDKALEFSYEETVITNGTDEYLIAKDGDKFLFISADTVFDDSKVELDEGWSPSETDNYKIISTIFDGDSVPDFTETGSINQAVQLKNSSLNFVDCNKDIGLMPNLTQPDPDDPSCYNHVAYDDLPAGTYTGNLSCTWTTHNINPDILQ